MGRIAVEKRLEEAPSRPTITSVLVRLCGQRQDVCKEGNLGTCCVESIPAQANSVCAVDRHSQRAAWCFRAHVS